MKANFFIASWIDFRVRSFVWVSLLSVTIKFIQTNINFHFIKMSEAVDHEENQEVDYEEAGIHEEYCPENPDAGEGLTNTEEVKIEGEGAADEEQHKIFPNILFIYGHRYNTVSSKQIREHFEPFGKIREISCRSQLAFVEFENAEDAQRAKDELHRKPGLGSPTIIVDFKKDIPPKVLTRFILLNSMDD